MAVNKVVYGSNTLIDLTGDTVTADKLLNGYTAHDKAGNPIIGNYAPAALPSFAGIKYIIPVTVNVPQGASASETAAWKVTVKVKSVTERLALIAVKDSVTNGYRSGDMFELFASCARNYSDGSYWSGLAYYLAHGSGNGNLYTLSGGNIPVAKIGNTNTLTMSALTGNTYYIPGTYKGFLYVYDESYSGAPSFVTDGSILDYVTSDAIEY